VCALKSYCKLVVVRFPVVGVDLRQQMLVEGLHAGKMLVIGRQCMHPRSWAASQTMAAGIHMACMN
jgi:hypothetical protein